MSTSVRQMFAPWAQFSLQDQRLTSTAQRHLAVPRRPISTVKVIEDEWLDRRRPYSLSQALGKIDEVRSVLILIHGAMNSSPPKYTKFIRNLFERHWREELKHTLVLKMYWGDDEFYDVSTTVGTIGSIRGLPKVNAGVES